MPANPRLVLFCPISQQCSSLPFCFSPSSTSTATMYFYLISQQCSSWSPESSAKSQQCPSLPLLCSPKGSFHLRTALCPYSATLCYEGTTTTHSAPRSPICLLAIFTSREKPSRYIRWSCTLSGAWRGVIHKVHYNRVHCIEQHAGYRAPDRVRTSHTNPHCPAIPIPAKSDP